MATPETTTIYGACDDLLEFDGRISEEFGAYNTTEGTITCSDGTVIGVNYDGNWNLTVQEKGPAFLSHTPAAGEDTDYSDKIVMGPIDWVRFNSAPDESARRAFAPGFDTPYHAFKKELDDDELTERVMLIHEEWAAKVKA